MDYLKLKFGVLNWSLLKSKKTRNQPGKSNLLLNIETSSKADWNKFDKTK